MGGVAIISTLGDRSCECVFVQEAIYMVGHLLKSTTVAAVSITIL